MSCFGLGATEYPDVHFIAVDVNGFDIDSENGTIPENVFCVTFKEEEAGYLAGYAAVKDGFTKLGFLGGWAEARRYPLWLRLCSGR